MAETLANTEIIDTVILITKCKSIIHHKTKSLMMQFIAEGEEKL